MKYLLRGVSWPIAVGVISLGVITIARAEPPKGVTPNVIGRATFDAFNLQSDPRAMEFSAQAKAPVDMLFGPTTTHRGVQPDGIPTPGLSSSKSSKGK